MEQNLSERERRVRLVLGIGVGLLAAVVYVRTGQELVAAVLAVTALGFIANYVTCFCGTKKAVDAIVERLRGREVTSASR